ncbi:hypothetical protein [Insolitispirillum peregrinum]|uniref:hypothetical protein n=1 Tax=Insolitispirillum peregrinum TaxID=80876 RepID=UPI0036181802
MKKKDNRIADLPSIKELSDTLPVARAIRCVAQLAVRMGLGGNKARQIKEAADQLITRSDIFHIPDTFNGVFAERGWIATSSMSMNVMRAALEKHNQGNTDAAEDIITDWALTPEIINLLAIHRSKAFGNVRCRWHQLREALALTEEGRYWSAVPLVLIACDGFASDLLGTSPFSKNADLSLFDSMVAHPTALPALISRIRESVKKSSDDALSLPLRHGILHGRSLGYADRKVCGKAWMLMIALVDWAADKRDEQVRLFKDEARRSTNWKDIFARLQRNRVNNASIEAFVPHRWEGPFTRDLAQDEPALAFHEFLTAWKNEKFGIMAKWAINNTKRNNNYFSGKIRIDAEQIKLKEFEIISISQTTVARAEAHVQMKGESLGRNICGEFLILAFRYTASGDVAMPTDEGTWHVQQNCMFDLMNERTIERRDSKA